MTSDKPNAIRTSLLPRSRGDTLDANAARKASLHLHTESKVYEERNNNLNLPNIYMISKSIKEDLVT